MGTVFSGRAQSACRPPWVCCTPAQVPSVARCPASSQRVTYPAQLQMLSRSLRTHSCGHWVGLRVLGFLPPAPTPAPNKFLHRHSEPDQTKLEKYSNRCIGTVQLPGGFSGPEMGARGVAPPVKRREALQVAGKGVMTCPPQAESVPAWQLQGRKLQ